MGENEMNKHYYVKDKSGYIEIEIIIKSGSKFFVHFPRYESQREILRANSCFIEMSREQLGALLFAYDEDEYHKFCSIYEAYVRSGSSL